MARRLNIGLSLAGNPAFLLLDECSTGLDPESRRTLWTLIEDVKKRTVTLPDGRVVNPTILLNTHSLEEAEALADRICIMDEGIIKALGTAQEIKSEHGTGYRVTVIAAGDSDEQMDEAEEVVEKAVKRKIMLVDQMFTTMIYAAPSKGVSLGSVASSLEQAQKRGKIDDWTVSTVSLEEIFLSRPANLDTSVWERSNKRQHFILSANKYHRKAAEISSLKLQLISRPKPTEFRAHKGVFFWSDKELYIGTGKRKCKRLRRKRIIMTFSIAIYEYEEEEFVFPLNMTRAFGIQYDKSIFLSTARLCSPNEVVVPLYFCDNFGKIDLPAINLDF
ncbi:ABC transporter A like protein [Aduncisulcus paluster]|uniref:ABC transporter A like protein n=1 Tax=Aduncisulcus paluster TaxID=2918883 RepID=A0ABQ5L0U9_9EUKA|nr:ABC transporter A like protein [Aduncisulcus paluster]